MYVGPLRDDRDTAAENKEEMVELLRRYEEFAQEKSAFDLKARVQKAMQRQGDTQFPRDIYEVQKDYYTDGPVREIYHTKNGVRHGLYRVLTTGGRILEESQYVDGIVTGPLKQYLYAKGEVLECTFKNGSAQGPYKHYALDGGEVVEEGIYDKGRKDGPYKRYYKSGALEEEGVYRKGNLIGIVKGYYETGELKSETKYAGEKGKRHGAYTKYDREGRPIEEASYSEGEKKEHITISYHGNGAVETITQYAKDKKHGLSLTYYPSGQLFKEETYKKDKLKSSKIMHPSGREIAEQAVPYVWPLHVEESANGLVSLKNQFDRVIGSGSVDGQGCAFRIWEFPDEPAQWMFSWLDEGDRIANASTEATLIKDKKVREVMLRQEGISDQQVIPSTEDVLQDIERERGADARHARQQVAHMMIAEGHAVIPGPKDKKALRELPATIPAHSPILQPE